MFIVCVLNRTYNMESQHLLHCFSRMNEIYSTILSAECVDMITCPCPPGRTPSCASPGSPPGTRWGPAAAPGRGSPGPDARNSRLWAAFILQIYLDLFSGIHLITDLNMHAPAAVWARLSGRGTAWWAGWPGQVCTSCRPARPRPRPRPARPPPAAS